MLLSIGPLKVTLVILLALVVVDAHRLHAAGLRVRSPRSPADLPCPTIPAPQTSSGSTLFSVYLPASVLAMRSGDPASWSLIGDSVLAALGLTGVVPTTFFLALDTQVSMGCVRADIVVYKNELYCLQQNVRTGTLALHWRNLAYPLSLRPVIPPLTTASSGGTTLPTTTPSTTTTTTTTTARSSRILTTTSAAAPKVTSTATKATKPTTPTSRTTTTSTPSTTTTTTTDASTTITAEPSTDTVLESTVSEDTTEYSTVEDGSYTTRKSIVTGHSQFQDNLTSASCDVRSVRSVQRLHFRATVPPSYWDSRVGFNKAVSALTNALGLSAQSTRDPTLDQLYDAQNVSGAGTTLIGLSIAIDAIPCVRQLFQGGGAIPVVLDGNLYTMQFVDLPAVEMKFAVNYDATLPTESDEISFTKTLRQTIISHGVAASNLLWIGIRPGSIEVTVCVSSADLAQNLSSTVAGGTFVVVFNNVTTAASLVVYSTQVQDSSSGLTGGVIAGIAVGAAIGAALLGVLVYGAAKHHAAAEAGKLDEMAWEEELPSPLPTLHFAVLLDDPKELKRALIVVSKSRDNVTAINKEDEMKQTPVGLAARLWLDTAVEMLLQYGADPNISCIQNLTPLHLACREPANVADIINGPMRCLNIVRHLLSAGADVNARDSQGASPIFYALFNSQCPIELLELLFHSGANINLQDNQKMTVFMSAAQMGFCEIVKFLLTKRQLHVNERDVNGRTALHWAVMCGSQDCVEAMVRQRRFMVCVQSGDGDTPLHLACREGYAEMVSMLIESCDTDYRSALVTAVNKYGNTAFDVALASEHMNCAKILMNYPISEPSPNTATEDLSVVSLSESDDQGIHSSSPHSFARTGHSDDGDTPSDASTKSGSTESLYEMAPCSSAPALPPLPLTSSPLSETYFLTPPQAKPILLSPDHFLSPKAPFLQLASQRPRLNTPRTRPMRALEKDVVSPNERKSSPQSDDMSPSRKRTADAADEGLTETEEEREARKRRIHCEYMRAKRQSEREEIVQMEKKVCSLQDDNVVLQAELVAARIEAERLRLRLFFGGADQLPGPVSRPAPVVMLNDSQYAIESYL